MSDSGVGSSPEIAEVSLDVSSIGMLVESGGSSEISKGVGSSTTKFLVGSPLSERGALEFGPDLNLGSSDGFGISSWAVVDWSTGSKSFGEVFIVPASLEDKDDDHDVKEGKSDKDETEHLSTSESGDETSMGAVSASIGNSGVGIDSDSHSNVTGNDGGHGSGKVGGSSVWEVGWGSLHAHLEEINSGSENDSERAGPNGKPDVFFVKESFGTFSNFSTNFLKNVEDGILIGLLFSADGFFLFLLFSVFINTFLDKTSLISHVNGLDEETGDGSPKNGSNSAAEDAKWSDSLLEIFGGVTMSDTVVVFELCWFCVSIEHRSDWHFSVIG